MAAAQRVLLTGINGFIGSRILDVLLAHGASVRGVVRTAEKVAKVKADFPSAQNLDFALVSDMTAPGAFDEAVKSSPPFDTVIHTASPFNYSTAKSNADFLEPAIRGTAEILRAIKNHAPEVKRVIITSSFAAIGNPKDLQSNGKVYTSEDWNPLTKEEAETPGDHRLAYWGSKKFAEKAAWDFVRDEKPNFELVVLNPPMVYGPLRHSIDSLADLNTSNNLLWGSFLHSSKDAALPPNGVHIDVDVRDLALAHYQAAIIPEARNKRFLLTRGSISAQEIVDILRKLFPEAGENIPLGNPGTSSLPEDAFNADNTPAKEILKLKFRSHEETFADLGKQLLDLEKQPKRAKLT